MNKWNGDKTVQVEPSIFTAFGIEIGSRYGNARELMELIAFARECADKGVEGKVKSASYDSKSCICSFELKDVESFDSPIAYKILDCAKATIGQFVWGKEDVVHHGGGSGRPL